MEEPWSESAPPAATVPDGPADSHPEPATRCFCPACGSPWLPSQTSCATCASRRSTPPILARTTANPVIAAVAFYFAVLALSVVEIIAIQAGTPFTASLILDAVLSVILVLVWTAAAPRSVLPGLSHLGPLYWYPIAALASVPTFLLATLLIKAFVAAFHIEEINLSPHFLRDGYSWFTIVLLVCIQPAVIEEIGFRGVILSGLQAALRPTEAILVSAACFAIIHLSVASMPHLLVLALALGFLRLRSGSLYPCMVLHFCHNLLCIATESPRP